MLIWRGLGWLVVGLAVGVAMLLYKDGDSAHAVAWKDVYFYVIMTAVLAITAFLMRKRKIDQSATGVSALFNYRDTFFWLPVWTWSALSAVGSVWKLVAAIGTHT